MTEKTKGLFAEFRQDYSSFLPRVNWRDFCVVHLGGEWNPMWGFVEWEICLLGLWYRGTYVYNPDTPMRVAARETAARLEEMMPGD